MKSKVGSFKPIVFLNEVKSEMEKVSWPSKKQAVRLTAIVLAAIVVSSIFLGSFDLLFLKITEILVK
ncbi:MAG: preprotein translocase subunit SecE [Patescibacteria group bacterium]|nr:preprotein translocase subunit SecE [Patescibacteria group bacterium]